MSPRLSRLRTLVLFAVASLAGWLHAAPAITQQPQATVIVTSGQAAAFSAQATGTGTIRWQWRRMGGALTGQTGPSLTLPAATMAAVGFYDVVATDDTGSTTSRPCRVLVTPTGGYPNTLRLDTSFNPLFELDGATINSIAVAPDGKVYACGNFTRIAGQPRAGLARFSADLVLDSSYSPVAASSLSSLLTQPDGKLLFRGSVRLADGRTVGPLGRLNADGSLDESFAAAAFRQSNGPVDVAALAPQPDGKILVAGSFDSVDALARSSLVRLNTDGSVDLSFNADLGAGPSITSVVVSHNKIILLGTFKRASGANYQLLRLASDGSRDTTFTQSSLARDFYRPLVVDSTGRIYAAAYFNAGTFPKTSAFVRLLDDGAIDPSYQCALGSIPRNATAMPDGRIAEIEYETYPKYSYGVLSTTGALDYTHSTTANVSRVDLTALAVSGANTLYIGGFSASSGFPFPGGLACYAPDGAPVTTAALGLRSAGFPQKLLPSVGGKWIVAGRFAYANNVACPGLVRLNADGSTDTAFEPPSLGLSIATLVTQGNGAILAVGDGPAVARRLLENGHNDPAFQFNAGTGFSSMLNDNIRVLPDGRFVAAGWIAGYNGESLNTGVVVLLPDGRRDPSMNLQFRPSGNIYALEATTNGGFSLAGGISQNYGSSLSLAWLNGLGEWIYPQSSDQGPFSVYRIGTDASGRLLLGGSFQSIGGKPLWGFARLNADGSVADAGADPARISLFMDSGLAAQSDNKVLIADSQGSINGVRVGPLFRVRADDSLDTAFSAADVTGFAVPSMQYTDEGRLLLCGAYGDRNGVAFNSLLMLKPEALPPLPLITRQPTSLNARVGELVTLSVKATGEGLIYRWYKDGQARSLGATLVLPNLQPSDFGRYSVEVSGPGGFVMSQTVMLGLSGVAGPRYRLLDYFNPLVVGNAWVYSRTGDTPERTHRRTAVVALDRSITSYTGGATAHPAVLRVAALSGAYGVASAGSFAPTSEWTDYYTGHGDRLGIGGSDSAGPLAQRFDGSFQLPATMAVGESAIIVSDSYRNGVWTGSQTAAYELIGIASVTTPAGVFSDCLRLRFSLVEDGPWRYEDQWWAPGVGLVKSYNGRPTGPAKEEELVSSTVQAATRPTITTQPTSQSGVSGTSVALTVAATGASPVTYQWYRGGRPVAGATSATLTFPSSAPADAGIYDVAVTDSGSTLSKPAVVGVLPPAGSQTAGAVTTRPEWQGIVHPKGNVYDQFLLAGNAGTFTAATGRVARMSFLDENESIVQVEMSGSGAITVVLDNASGPMAPSLYNQSGILYMKGKATIVLAGADATTHFTTYSVGTATNPGVTRSDVEYAGWADVAAAGIVSTNGGLGGIHQGNVDYNASVGFTGLYAPTVTSVAGSVVIHSIAASVDATPYLYFNPTAQVQVKIAGSALAQPNTDSITVSGLSEVTMGAGQDSCGRSAPAAAIQTRLVEDSGTDVTAAIVTGP